MNQRLIQATRTLGPPRRRPVGGATAAALVMLGLVNLPASGLAPPPSPTGSREPVDAAKLLSILIDPQSAGPARESAAEDLLPLAQRTEIARALSAILQDEPDTGHARPILLSAISRCWEPPSRLYHPLVEALAARSGQAPPDPDLPQFIAAVGAYRTRDAADLLIRRLQPESPPAERQAAAAALVRMSGRDDFGDDPGPWAGWLEQARGLSGQQWDDLLAQGVWRNAQRAESDRRALATGLIEGYRRLYLALPASPGDERVRLLVQMLLGPRPELLDLGVEIVSREVASGKTMDRSIVDAAAKLLTSPDPAVRSRAVTLVMQFTPADAAGPVAHALDQETDPGVAAMLLTAAARWPRPACTAAALRWLRAGGATLAPANDCLDALRAAGYLAGAADQAVVLTQIRAMKPEQMTPPAVRLLATLGENADRERVAAMLDAEQPSLRLAAADAISDRAEYTDRVLAAAGRDPPLFGVAVRAIRENRPTAEGYRQVAELEAVTPQERRAGLLRVCGVLPVPDLVRIAQRPDVDAPMREAMLARLAEQGPTIGQAVEDRAALMEGLELLAETRVAMKRPDLAVEALDALPPSPDGLDPEKLRSLRTVSLLWANQIDRATEVGAAPDAWLDGLERAIGEPHARAILRELRTRFGRALTPAQADRLNRLAARIVQSESTPADHAAVSTDESTPSSSR